jgi:hypothetical protein
MGAAARRVTPARIETYQRLIDVDVGNDGIAQVATFTAAGTAQAQCGPSGLGQSWSLDQAYLSTSVGQLDPAQCSLYVGPLALQPYLVTQGLGGGGSQFGLGGIGLSGGWYVYALWTGGTSGAQALLRVTGTKTALVQ